jgi:type IV pilus assembly protein PilN
MRITTNLASRPFTDLGPALRRLRIAMGGLVLVAAAFGAGLYSLHSKAEVVRAHERSLDSNIGTVREEMQSYETMVRQPDNAQVLDHAATLNRLFDEKAFSWTLAMEDLETVLPGGVQVRTLEPMRDKKDGHITLRMRVLGPRDKSIELVQNLERSRRFLAPRITSESLEAEGNGNQQLEPVSPTNRVTFDLLADYNPATPDERRAMKKNASLEEISAKSTSRHGAKHTADPQGHPGSEPQGRPAYSAPSPQQRLTPRPASPRPGGTR